MFLRPEAVKVGDRFRGIDEQTVQDLVVSIGQVGQLQPILVTSDLELVDGLHRLEACKRLDREVWAETESDGKLLLDDPVQRRRAELQANLWRKNFEPLELARAVAELDALMKQTYGDASQGGRGAKGWSYDDTAKLCGFRDKSSVSRLVMVANAADELPQLKGAKTMKEALKVVKAAARLEAARELVKRKQKSSSFDPSKVILNCDCREGLRQLQSGVCDIFVTDPPFGVELDRAVDDRPEAKARLLGAWHDKPDDIMKLLSDVIGQMARVGKLRCQVFMFCATEHFWTVRQMFEDAGFKTLRRPYIWVKAHREPFRLIGCGRTNDPYQRPASTYETAVYAWRGDARLAKPGHPDILVHPRLLNSIHPSQKPVELLVDIISCLVDPASNPMLIDPFAGVGTTLVAARRLGITQVLGFELNEEYCRLAMGMLAAEA